MSFFGQFGRCASTITRRAFSSSGSCGNGTTLFSSLISLPLTPSSALLLLMVAATRARHGRKWRLLTQL